MPDLSQQEKNALRILLNSLSPTLAHHLAEQAQRELTLEVPDVQMVPIAELLNRTDRVLATVFSLSQPLTVDSVLLFDENAARLLADLLSGNDGTNPPDALTEPLIEKLTHLMTGITRSFATALANATGVPADVEASNTTFSSITLPPIFALEENAVQARFALSLPDGIDSEMLVLLTPDFARMLTPDTTPEDGTGTAAGGDSVLSEDDLAAMLSDLGSIGGQASGGTGGFALPGTMPAGGLPSPGMFPPFPTSTPETGLPRGIDLILDIPLDVTVELGRVRMLIKDVLELSPGSIVELDRVAGEPVDLLVNGRLVAKGEVVVIEDNFGIRITEIVSPAERVAGLGKGR